ncbi:MAG TPA: enoyl-CoA hydratase [Stellaceae bacterium]|nr:enoyl-CoA hydratase [Stellaceae bacterium]
MNVSLRFEDRPGGKVAFLTIDHREKLNVLNRAGIDAVNGKLAELSGDQHLRALVLRGAGDKAFIGGADIRDLVKLDRKSGIEFITALHRVCEGIRHLEVPVIARIEGYALGGGLEVAASCDLRISGLSGRFGMPEVKVGIPSVIEAALLPGLIGWGRTRRFLLLAETIDAATALKWGLIEEAVPDAELDQAIETALASILACGREALRLQKLLIQEWEDLPMRDAIERGITRFADSFGSDEPQRMMAKFLTRGRS